MESSWRRSIQATRQIHPRSLYSKCLLNVASMKKPNGKWKCVDYTQLNKACPKDCTSFF